jgi:hypothetical protein
MPMSPGGLCRQCDKRAIDGRRYCADHATTGDDVTTASNHWSAYRADDPVRKLYKTTRWQRVRRIVFQRDPLCVLCGHRAANVGDHHPIAAHELVATLGVDAFFDASRIRGVCQPCHDGLRHTA